VEELLQARQRAEAREIVLADRDDHDAAFPVKLDELLCERRA
jgi:hypothetical protein